MRLGERDSAEADPTEDDPAGNDASILEWIASGDPSLAYLVDRDLRGIDDPGKRAQIGTAGWCAEYLKRRNPDGGWGRRFYQPKWICSHYTILELRNLEYPPGDPLLLSEIRKIGYENRASDGGINPSVSMDVSDTCVTGMYLRIAAYYGAGRDILDGIVDHLLGQTLCDGGYNCNLSRIGAVHSSLHTSTSVLEGFGDYVAAGNSYRRDEVVRSMEGIAEFMLRHRLFRSSRTGDVIDPKMLAMTYPFRWKHTVLRALNAFADCGVAYDPRMDDALDYIESKRSKDGTWKMQSPYPGQVWFETEKPGMPGRMITLLALKALGRYGRTP